QRRLTRKGLEQVDLLRGQQAAWRGGTYPQHPDRPARAQQWDIEGLSTRQGRCAEPRHLAVHIDPLGHGAFLRIEGKEGLTAQTVALPICSSLPLAQVPRGIGEEQTHLAVEDLVQMAGGSLEQAVDIPRTRQRATQRVERCGTPFPVAG